MKIAVYPGSFNPIHIGHKAVIEHIVASADFDGVYLVVSPKNPLKDGINADSGRSRYEAAVKTMEKFPVLHVKVSDIELGFPPPHYTIRTLDALHASEPCNEFTLIIGGDSLASFRQWRSYSRILTEYGVAVYPRSGYDSGALKADLEAENAAYRIRLLAAPVVDISSTEIRKGIEAGKDMGKWLM